MLPLPEFLQPSLGKNPIGFPVITITGRGLRADEAFLPQNGAAAPAILILLNGYTRRLRKRENIL
jgi:hypothetical protein